jgi:hypothetical protein
MVATLGRSPVLLLLLLLASTGASVGENVGGSNDCNS